MIASNDDPQRQTNDKTDGRAIPLIANRIDARDLFMEGREIIIAHGAEQYRLRLTAQNKLILTK